MLALALLLADVSSGGPLDYFPITDKVTLVYRLGDGKFSEHKLIKREKIDGVECCVYDTWGFFTEEQTKIYLSATREGIRMHRLDFGGFQMNLKPPVTMLPYPIRRNTDHKQDVKLDYGRLNLAMDCSIVTRVEGTARVTVAAGTFQCLLVRSTWEASFQGNASKSVETTWYAPGIGIVKRTMISDSAGARQEQSLELQRVEKR